MTKVDYRKEIIYPKMGAWWNQLYKHLIEEADLYLVVNFHLAYILAT